MEHKEDNIILNIVNLYVECEGIEILHGINLIIRQGEIHVLLGPNGSGKSTLLNTIMGLSIYKIKSGEIWFKGVNITNMTISERSELGVGIMFQRPPSIPGLKLTTLVKTAFSKNVDHEKIAELCSSTNMTELIDRDVNVGFSGGEMKRSELFQILLQNPELILLDEPESGVDLENINLVGSVIRSLQLTTDLGNRSVLVITHTGHILKYLPESVAHIMNDGLIHAQGNTSELFDIIKNEGYSECIRRVMAQSPSVELPNIFSPLPIVSPINIDSCNNCCYKNDTFCIGTKPKPKQCSGDINNCPLGKDCTCKQLGYCKCVASGLPKGSCVKANFNTANQPTGCELGNCSQCKIKDNCISKIPTVTKNDGKIILNNDDNDFLLGPSIEENPIDIMSTNNNNVSLSNHDNSLLYNGEYTQYNNKLGCYNPSSQEGIEVLSLTDAIQKYPEIVDKYLWKVMDPNKDDITKAVKESEKTQYNGYVVIAHEGSKCTVPVKSNLLMENCYKQIVHNLVIAKKNSTLFVSSFCRRNCSGCDPIEQVDSFNTHFGISEFFVEEDAHLSFNMVHTYNSSFIIYPRSASRVDKNGVFISSYICLNEVKKVQMAPVAYLEGENSIARFSSVLLSSLPETELDIGSTAFLKAKGCRTEMIARALCRDGCIINRGRIVSHIPDTFGHIECQGLVIGGKGYIRSIPEIEAGPNAELSHEASVGKIDQEKIDYLMSRGINEESAVSIIVRGFLDVTIKGIPQSLQDEISYIMEQASHGL